MQVSCMEYSCAVFGARNLYKKNLVQETMSDCQVSCTSRLVQVSWLCVTIITVFARKPAAEKSNRIINTPAVADCKKLFCSKLRYADGLVDKPTHIGLHSKLNDLRYSQYYWLTNFSHVYSRPLVITIDVINVLTFFIQVTFFTFLTFFYFFHVFIKKTLSNAKYKYVKIQRKIFLEDDLAMIFYWFCFFT